MPPRTPPPLLPPINQETRGRERTSFGDRTPTREYSPSVERLVHTVPFSRQRSQSDTDRPKSYVIVPYTRQGSIHQEYRTPQTTRWSRAEHRGAILVNGFFSAIFFLANIKPDQAQEWYVALRESSISHNLLESSKWR